MSDPSDLLRMANDLAARGELGFARTLFRQIVEEHRRSPAAEDARRWLADHRDIRILRCHACGKTLDRPASACPYCDALQQNTGLKSRTAAGALAILVGGLGIHRFYLRQWWGIFYLLFVWTYIPAVISFIEGLVFLLTNQENWDRKYNHGSSSGSASSRTPTIVAVIAVVVVLVVGGILAAAYRGSTLRERASEAFLSTYELRRAVLQTVAQNGDVSNEQLAKQASQVAQRSRYLEYVRVEPTGRVTVGFNSASGLRGETIIFDLPSEPGGVWTCSAGTLANEYRTAYCMNPLLREP